MNETCHMLIDYFNRTLTDKEVAQFEAHLIECPSCQEELAEWESLTEDLPFLSEEVEVPTDLKARVFKEIEAPLKTKASTQPTIKKSPVVQKKKRFKFAVPTLAAALFLSLLSNVYLIDENNKASEGVESDLQLIGKTVLSSESEDASAIAMLLSDQGEEVLIVDADRMPALSEGELYQVWVIDGEQPYPAGVIELADNGKGSTSHRLTGLDGEWDTIAITIEKTPNLPLAEGPVVMAGGI